MKPLRRQPHVSRRSMMRAAMWALGIAMLVIVLAFLVTRTDPRRLPELDTASLARLQSRGMAPADSSDLADIIAQFVCSCGQCRTLDALRHCNCAHPRGAKEVTQFIRDLVARRELSPLKIVEAVDSTYGGRL